jgi:hypothetical protein
LLRLGFFPLFKNDDTVLLTADAEGIRVLVDAIAKVGANPSKAIPLHDLARVSAKHPAALYAAVNAAPIGSVAPNTYFLDLSGNAAFNSVAMLEQLMHSSSAHQYFDLVPTPTVLMVSVGEYDSYWWDGVESG